MFLCGLSQNLFFNFFLFENEYNQHQKIDFVTYLTNTFSSIKTNIWTRQMNLF
jgi:hypothetical protein